MTELSEDPIRLLTISYTVPTEASGTPVVIRRLLENLRREEVVLVARPPRRRTRQPAVSLPYQVIQVPTLPVGVRGDRYWMIASVVPALAVSWRAVRRYRPDIILSFFPDEGSLLTGHLLSKLTRLPHVIYLCDLYLESPRPNWQQWLARWLQPRLFEAADKVVVVNEAMAHFYRDRYDLDAVVVPTCINSQIPEYRKPEAPGDRLIIGFAGSVNEDRLGPLRELTSLVRDRPDYEIRYFSGQGEQVLRSSGLWASNVRIQLARDDEELHGLLSECDVLLLPLTFHCREAQVIQLSTCFGIKAYDYFLSQKPILVHCPGRFFTSRFFQDRRCGLCVTSEGTGELEAALQRLRTESALRESLVKNALAAAREFEGGGVAQRLRSTLAGLAPRRDPAKADGN